jgi:hypothetical protein
LCLLRVYLCLLRAFVCLLRVRDAQQTQHRYVRRRGVPRASCAARERARRKRSEIHQFAHCML